jgi:hypothetical protein
LHGHLWRVKLFMIRPSTRRMDPSPKNPTLYEFLDLS